MAVFQAVEMWDCDPVVLIDFVWVGWCKACLCSECELCHTVSLHLSWVTTLKIKGRLLQCSLCYIWSNLSYFLRWGNILDSQD